MQKVCEAENCHAVVTESEAKNGCSHVLRGGNVTVASFVLFFSFSFIILFVSGHWAVFQASVTSSKLKAFPSCL